MPKYIGEDYVYADYVDNDTTTITPTDTIVSIPRKVEIDTEGEWEDEVSLSWFDENSQKWTTGTAMGREDISKYVDEIEISRAVGRAYATVSISISNLLLPSYFIKSPTWRLYITLGTDTYTVVIIDLDTDSYNKSSLVCKTEGCLLDEPFSLKSNDTILGNSHSVLSALLSPIDSTILVSSFDFNKGTFEKNGSNLSAIESILSVTKGELVYRNNKLIISKALRVSDDTDISFIIDKKIIIDAEVTDDIDGTPLLKRVIINDEYIYTEPKITMFYDEVSQPYFLFVPQPTSVSQIKSNLGEIILSNKAITFTSTISSNHVKLDGSIISIGSVQINNEEITSYEVDMNVIKFDTHYTNASINIIYLTSALEFYSINGITVDDNKREYKIEYLNQKLTASIDVLKSEKGVSRKNYNIGLSGGGHASFPAVIVKDEPISLYTPSGEIDNISFISNKEDGVRTEITTPVKMQSFGLMDDSFMNNVDISKTSKNITINKQITYTPYGLGFTIKSGNYRDFKIGTRSIDFNKYSNLGYDTYYTKDKTSLNATVTFTELSEVDKVTIPSVGLSNNIKYAEVTVGGETIKMNYPNPDDKTLKTPVVSYRLPQTITINVADEFSTQPYLVLGKTISSITLGDKKIDGNGNIVVTVSTARLHKFDCNSIQQGGVLYVDSRGSKL